MGHILTRGHNIQEDNDEYYPLFGNLNYSTGIGDDRDKARHPLSLYGVITQVYVTLCSSDGTPVSPGEGEWYQISIEGKNTPVGTFSGRIEDTDTNVTIRCMLVVVPDEELNYRVIRTSGASAGYVRISAVMWTATASESHISGHFSPSSSGTFYAGMGRLGTGNGEYRIYAPMGGTLSHLYVHLEDEPGAGKSYTWTLMKNGSPTTLTVTVSNTDDEGSDTAHSVSFDATDKLSLKQVPTNSPTASDIAFSMKLTTQNDVFFMSGGGFLFGAACPDNAPVCGMFPEPYGTGVYKTICHDMTLTAMFVEVESAPGAGETIDITVVKETDSAEEDTALTVELTEGETTANITTDVALSKGDAIYLRRDRDGPAITDEWWVGVAAKVTHTAPTISAVNMAGKTAYANLSAIGDGSSCSIVGFCYKAGITGDPDIFNDTIEVLNDFGTLDGEYATGEHSLELSLSDNVAYRVRPFAVNDTSVAYGETMQALSYPSDSMARVSSIRRVYRPGLYRMEVGLGDLGFDVEVSEAAIKRVPDEVTPPEDTEPEEVVPPMDLSPLDRLPTWMQPDATFLDRYKYFLNSGVIPTPIAGEKTYTPQTEGGAMGNVAKGIYSTIGRGIQYIQHPLTLVQDLFNSFIGLFR